MTEIITKTVPRKGVGRETKIQTERRRKLFQYLNSKLEEVGGLGEVRSVICYNKTTNLLLCSGHLIAEGRVFRVLNLNTRTTVKRPPVYHLSFPRCRRGVFVQLDNFEPCADNLWVALVGVPLADNELNALPYPRESLPK